MRTIPVTLRDMVLLGMYGEDWQIFVDHYDEQFNAITIDGFEFAPVSLGYQFQQMLSKVGATVLPTYVDPESEGFEMPLGAVEGKTGNIPTQKLFYSVNRVVVREQMQLAQRFGQMALDDEIASVAAFAEGGLTANSGSLSPNTDVITGTAGVLDTIASYISTAASAAWPYILGIIGVGLLIWLGRAMLRAVRAYFSTAM